MNRVTIIGNLTADPTTRTTQDGRTVCNFSVAVNRRKPQGSQNQETDFFRVSAWDKTGENCQKYLSKGRKVCVVGPVSVNTYQASDGSTKTSMNVQAYEVEFLSGKSDGEQGGAAQAAPAADVQPNLTPVDISDSELPF